jgi:hypothetical protein
MYRTKDWGGMALAHLVSSFFKLMTPLITLDFAPHCVWWLLCKQVYYLLLVLSIGYQRTIHIRDSALRMGLLVLRHF